MNNSLEELETDEKNKNKNKQSKRAVTRNGMTCSSQNNESEKTDFDDCYESITEENNFYEEKRDGNKNCNGFKQP